MGHQAVMQQEHPSHQKVNMVTIHMQDHPIQHREVNMVTIHMQDHPLQHREVNMDMTMTIHHIQDLLIADQVTLPEDHMVDQQDHLDAQTMAHQEDLYINRSFL